jgi:hypothetical protein
VQAERDRLRPIIDELNEGTAALAGLRLSLFRWETDTYPGFHLEGPQGIVDDIMCVDQCDLMIGIFWKKFGTPTRDANSGTEHEFLTAYEFWKKASRPQIMMYFKEAPYTNRA